MAVEENAGTVWVASLSRFGIRPGLDRTRQVLKELGNPESRLAFFHVAGTNGKGSVCAYLQELLVPCGKTGVFTSPSFDGYLERITIQREHISAADFNRIARNVKAAVDRVTPDDPLTEFEVLTVMAIRYFAERHVQYVVWETGLGGTFDSTNVVTPVVSAITNVGMDHMNVLGPTIRHIARDKAGVIKEGRPFVTGAEGEALTILEERARASGGPFYVAGRSFMATLRGNNSGGGRSIDYRGLIGDWVGLPAPLFGMHQARNMAIALAMLEVAEVEGVAPRRALGEIREALALVRWPGRFELVHSGSQVVVLDGAHNREGARALAQGLRDLGRTRGLPDDRWTLVVGVLADKVVRDIVREVIPLGAQVVATAPRQPRALSATALSEVITGLCDVPVRVEPSVTDALDVALQYHQPVCCFGSLYTVHEARKHILNKPV